MNIREQQLVDNFLKPIAEMIGCGEQNWRHNAFGMPLELPPDELQYCAEKFLKDYSGKNFPTKKALRKVLETHIQGKQVQHIKARSERKPDWERGADGIRYRDGLPLLCDLPLEERLAIKAEVLDRVSRRDMSCVDPKNAKGEKKTFGQMYDEWVALGRPVHGERQAAE